MNYYRSKLTNSYVNNHSVSKVEFNGGSYITKNTAIGDIVADDAIVAMGNNNSTFGYNLYDANSSYKISQENAEELQLGIDYENCYLGGGSAAGSNIIFDNSGYVSVEGEMADYNISMIFDNNYPTDWFAFDVVGKSANNVAMTKASNGYVLTADNMEDVIVSANNKNNNVECKFSTEYNEVFIYQIDENTIGIAVDTDNNGTYETTIPTSSTETKDESNLVKGDISGNNKIDLYDAIEICKFIMNMRELTDDEYTIADFDGNEVVDLYDAIGIAKELLPK